jgi:hypothetical protein
VIEGARGGLIEITPGCGLLHRHRHISDFSPLIGSEDAHLPAREDGKLQGARCKSPTSLLALETLRWSCRRRRKEPVRFANPPNFEVDLAAIPLGAKIGMWVLELTAKGTQ